MKRRFANGILITLLAALILDFASLAGAEEEWPGEGSVAGLTPRLPKTVTEYAMDFETKQWEATRLWTYTYENGYPVLVDCFDLYEDGKGLSPFVSKSALPCLDKALTKKLILTTL